MNQSPTAPPMSVNDAAERAGRILDEVSTVIVGKRDALTKTLVGVLAGGHVLLEDFPGVGKTLTAKSFAEALGLDFARAQFTPDLLPSDLTGSEVFNQATSTFEFRPGPIFTGLLLADEINRTPPKTQAALLEAMQERQVSVEGTTHRLPSPFHVLATANPIETEGTYPLPEAQLDRFLIRISFGYPSPEEEWDVVSRRIQRKTEDQRVSRVLEPGELRALQEAVEQVSIAEHVGRYAVDLVHETRRHEQLAMGASPRGSLALIQCARALALVEGRDFVIPEDVKALAEPCLGHRVAVKPELWLHNIQPSHVISQILTRVRAPEASAG